MTLKDFKQGSQITGVIDLSKLPPPVFYKKRSFEEIFEGLKTNFLKIMVERGVKDFNWTSSDPSYVMAEAASYEILRVISDGNYNASQCLAAFAEGGNLDQILLLLGAERQPLSEIDPVTQKQKKESDSNFLRRALLFQDRFSTAGAVSAYQYHVYKYCTEELKTELVDVRPTSPDPGEVLVPLLLSKERMDLAAKEPEDAAKFVKLVADYLNRPEVKPLTDTITVQLAKVVEKSLGKVVLRTPRGVSPDSILKAAVDSLKSYREKRYAIGEPITISGIHAALTVSTDVIDVKLTLKDNLKPEPDEAYYLLFNDKEIVVTDSEILEDAA